MKVYFIGAGPGDPELLTLKAVRILSETHLCIFAGSLVNPKVLTHVPLGAEVMDSSKMSLDDMKTVFKRAKRYETDIARLHTGDPSIYGAIREQMDILDELEIEYEVIPGVSSFQATAATLKKELTMPEVSQTIILSRMAGRTPVPDSQSIEKLAATKSTLCLFLSVGMIESLVEKLEIHYAKTTPVAVVYKASWCDEKKVTGTLEDIAEKVKEAGIKKTAMIVVGDCLGDEKHTSLLYDKAFSHGYRKGE